MTAWDELLDEFRALGGTADNIRLGVGEFGRGLFPIDPAKPVAIRVPENLLLAVGELVYRNGTLQIGPNANVNPRERAWLDRYQSEFAWGGGGGDEVRKLFETAGQLPAELRNKLHVQYGCGRWFMDPTDALIVNAFLTARSILYRDRSVIMPIVEMANHGTSAEYNLTDGVALNGTFPGEVVAEYSPYDSRDYFITWGFAIQRPSAFSVFLTGQIDSTPMEIDQQFKGSAEPYPRGWIPKVETGAGKVRLPHLLIGQRQFPRIPKGIFYQTMRKAGYKGVEEAFDLVHHVNRLHFINLLMEIEGIDLPIARTLRNMAFYQLRAMSFCYGVREV